MRQRMRVRAAVCALALVLAAGCAKNRPPNLTPEQTKLWQANEVVVALGTLQHAAIGLNGVQVCDQAGANCHAVLSDHNTGIVVDNVTAALKTIRAVPDGWNATANAALDQIVQRLDAMGKTSLQPYVEAARLVINQLVKEQAAPSGSARAGGERVLVAAMAVEGGAL